MLAEHKKMMPFRGIYLSSFYFLTFTSLASQIELVIFLTFRPLLGKNEVGSKKTTEILIIIN
jgi:hypothetical protein